LRFGAFHCFFLSGSRAAVFNGLRLGVFHCFFLSGSRAAVLNGLRFGVFHWFLFFILNEAFPAMLAQWQPEHSPKL